MLYQILELEDTSRPGPPGLIDFAAEVRAEVEARGGQLWGLFGNLLGLPTNRVYLVVCASEPINIDVTAPIDLVSERRFRATSRPQTSEAQSTPGVYVFRWFQIRPDSVDEIVQLSGQAWPAFEGEFATEVKGLFVEDTPGPTTMLLITWYQDLSVWEASRQPAPEARQNFQRRHQLTRSALPIATTLLSGGSRLVSHS